MASISTLWFLSSRLFAKSRLLNVNFHFGHKILCLKSRLYVKSRFVKSRLFCIFLSGARWKVQCFKNSVITWPQCTRESICCIPVGWKVKSEVKSGRKYKVYKKNALTWLLGHKPINKLYLFSLSWLLLSLSTFFSLFLLRSWHFSKFIIRTHVIGPQCEYSVSPLQWSPFYQKVLGRLAGEIWLKVHCSTNCVPNKITQ